MSKKELTLEKALKEVAAIKAAGKKPTNQQAEELRKSSKAFRTYLEEIAGKFGTAEKGARNRAAFPMLNDNEWELLPYCERTFKDGLFPYIGGHQTHPMTSVLTLEEAEAYYKRQKEHAVTGVSTGSKLTPEQQEAIIKIKNLAATNGLESEWELLNDLLPKSKSSLLEKLTGYGSLMELDGKKLSLTRLMFRNSDGLPPEPSDVDAAKAMADGYYPSLTIQQVKDMICKIKEKGIDLTSYLTDDAKKAIC